MRLCSTTFAPSSASAPEDEHLPISSSAFRND
jgi:hypothetical protein